MKMFEGKDSSGHVESAVRGMSSAKLIIMMSDEKNFEGMHSNEKARKIEIIEGDYDPKAFFEAARGYETCKEGGERCRKCFELRLRETARVAKEMGFEYITTTLTISPLKNADVLNEVGQEAASLYGITFLPSDFKKKEGYKRSIELSQKFGLYRQNFCGCSFSKNNI